MPASWLPHSSCRCSWEKALLNHVTRMLRFFNKSSFKKLIYSFIISPRLPIWAWEIKRPREGWLTTLLLSSFGRIALLNSYWNIGTRKGLPRCPLTKLGPLVYIYMETVLTLVIVLKHPILWQIHRDSFCSDTISNMGILIRTLFSSLYAQNPAQWSAWSRYNKMRRVNLLL